jgi:MerR family transcriptional regulator, copper efflux regulator
MDLNLPLGTTCKLVPRHTMQRTLTISALARQAGVSPKTLRYWEGLGLLPRATRGHNGYRLFNDLALSYVRFIQKSRDAGLKLTEMREILRLARRGHCPCAEVIHWTERNLTVLDEQIRQLFALRRRLRRILSTEEPCTTPCGDVCSLLLELPEARLVKGGYSGGKAENDRVANARSASCNSAAGDG